MNNLPQPRLGRGHEPSTADVAILGPVFLLLLLLGPPWPVQLVDA